MRTSSPNKFYVSVVLALLLLAGEVLFNCRESPVTFDLLPGALAPVAFIIYAFVLASAMVFLGLEFFRYFANGSRNGRLNITQGRVYLLLTILCVYLFFLLNLSTHYCS
jgi:hypothetical protein